MINKLIEFDISWLKVGQIFLKESDYSDFVYKHSEMNELIKIRIELL